MAEEYTTQTTAELLKEAEAIARFLKMRQERHEKMSDDEYELTEHLITAFNLDAIKKRYILAISSTESGFSVEWHTPEALEYREYKSHNLPPIPDEETLADMPSAWLDKLRKDEYDASCVRWVRREKVR